MPFSPYYRLYCKSSAVSKTWSLDDLKGVLCFLLDGFVVGGVIGSPSTLRAALLFEHVSIICTVFSVFYDLITHFPVVLFMLFLVYTFYALLSSVFLIPIRLQSVTFTRNATDTTIPTCHPQSLGYKTLRIMYT